MQTETNQELFARFAPSQDGAYCTCRVLDNGLEEWAECGRIDGLDVKVYWLFGSDPDGYDFTAANIDRIEFVDFGTIQ